MVNACEEDQLRIGKGTFKTWSNWRRPHKCESVIVLRGEKSYAQVLICVVVLLAGRCTTKHHAPYCEACLRFVLGAILIDDARKAWS